MRVVKFVCVVICFLAGVSFSVEARNKLYQINDWVGLSFRSAVKMENSLSTYMCIQSEEVEKKDTNVLLFNTSEEWWKEEVQKLKVKVQRQHCLLYTLLGSIIILMMILVACFYSRCKVKASLQEKKRDLDMMREYAQHADRMRALFIQNMSHEIRTPLNSIVGFSQILTDSNVQLGEEEKKDLSVRIVHNSELLTTLIDDVIDLSGLESGNFSMSYNSWYCNDLCREVLPIVMHRKSDKVKLYFTSEVSDDFLIMTDKKRVQQVLVNLLTNAEKNTEAGEIHLHCSISENPGKIIFSVTDTGIGIPKDKMEVIFDRFEKLDGFKQGIGIGLSICRAISERLGGEIKVDKEFIGGARFLFVLPLTE